jgi:sugar diacid utilization regulator
VEATDSVVALAPVGRAGNTPSRHRPDRPLEAYFAAGSSPSRAAGTLHVHVNTVAQRLERIGSLLGAGWQPTDRALELQLALRLRKLRPSGMYQPLS